MNPYIATDETEIDLLDLGKYLLRRIVWILLAGVVVAAGAGAYAHFSRKPETAIQGEAESETETETETETELETETETELTVEFDRAQYRRDLAQYQEQSEMLDTADESLRDLVRKQEEFLRESPYLKLDPYHVWKAYTIVQIESLDRNYPAYQIRELYRNAIYEGDYLSDLAKKRKTDLPYLIQMVGAWATGSATGVGGTETDIVLQDEWNEERQTIELMIVQGMGNTKKEAQELLDAAMEEVERSRKVYARKYPHTIKVLSEYCSQSVDTGIRNNQKDYEAYTQALMSQIKDNKDKEAWLVKPKSEEDLKEELAEQKRAEAEALKQAQAQAETAPAPAPETETEEEKPQESPQKKMAKYGLIGFVIGALLMCLVFVLRYMFNDLLVSYKDVERKGFALKNLGSITEQGAAMAAASIRSFAGDRRKLFLTGLSQADAFERAVSGLKKELDEYELVCAADVLTDPKARELLLDCDAVILIEQTGVSRYSKMREEVTFLYHAGKEIVGVVIV